MHNTRPNVSHVTRHSVQHACERVTHLQQDKVGRKLRITIHFDHVTNPQLTALNKIKRSPWTHSVNKPLVPFVVTLEPVASKRHKDGEEYRPETMRRNAQKRDVASMNAIAQMMPSHLAKSSTMQRA